MFRDITRRFKRSFANHALTLPISSNSVSGQTIESQSATLSRPRASRAEKVESADTDWMNFGKFEFKFKRIQWRLYLRD